MIEKLKETFSHAFIFGLGGVLTKLIGFILIPLYTREISVAEYGMTPPPGTVTHPGTVLCASKQACQLLYLVT